MNLKSILDRINLVTRSRFAANSNAAWLIWAKDILLEIDGICTGPGRVINFGVAPTSFGTIEWPQGVSDIKDVRVDGEAVDFIKNRRQILITDETATPEVKEMYSVFWAQNGISGELSYDPAFAADDYLKGFTVSNGLMFADIVTSKHINFAGNDSIGITTTQSIPFFASSISSLYLTNTRCAGYEKMKAPDTITEELDLDDDWASMLAAGLWYMAENDMDPAGRDCAARKARYDELKKAYIASTNRASGRSLKPKFQFTPRRNR